MKRFFTLVFVGVLCGSFTFAGTGTVTQVITKQGSVMKHLFTWVADSTNDCAIGTGTVKVSGEVLRVVFDSTISTANVYTVTMKDQNKIDILVGAGTSLATNSITSIRPAIVMSSGITTNFAPIAINDLLTISVTGSTASASGTITVYSK